MKKLTFILAAAALITSCSSEHKNNEDADSAIDTNMSASPGLDTSGFGTDTSLKDTTNTINNN